MKVAVQLIGAPRVFVELEDGVPVQAGPLQEAVAAATGRPVGSFKMVAKGSTLPEAATAQVRLEEGDTILVVPQRKAPSEKLVAAAINARAGRRAGDDDDDEEEDDEPVRLPPGAPAWEVKLVDLLRRKGCAPWALEWLVFIRPIKVLILLAFLVACKVASHLGVGPVFILVSIIFAIFRNLGKKKEGELSSYSIFNPGARRLPGQLDADQIDQQMRRGQM